MSVAVIITDRNTDQLCRHLRQCLPDILIQQWPDIEDPDSVRLAVLWQHPAGITQHFPQLEAVVSMGAGMDHIEADAAIPEAVNKWRVVTPVLQQNMAQYVLQHVLAEQRHAKAYLQQQQAEDWRVLESNEPMPVVGFLGLGQLGGFVADRCLDLGFRTLAWTASQQHPQHPCHHGPEGLQTVCANCRYLVILLPLNEHTRHVINEQSLAWCQPETTLINVGRGGHVDELALLRALDAGRLKRAVLDVFAEEPLPAGHPFWQHPRVTLTPHSSSRSDVAQTATEIAALYQRLVAV
ncbi:NAD(P)-dependent oxidoreductase [Marinicella meishanensis]|uniref:NAD(P)-dependent oxidoreductase n=1 Tax=Marinicella meishanensis TaxID=2873263 RepID=UPI001CBE497B|nr:NAD(P)-dependent oxidoreductase [Marinicella sp. NBU2979]